MHVNDNGTDNAFKAFCQGYVECALWASVDENGEPLDGVYSVDDIAEQTRWEMLEDCVGFWHDYHESIIGNPGRAGHDFWLTRNGHGAGFWDGCWGDKVGRELTDAAHVYGSSDLYIGDDGVVYAA